MNLRMTFFALTIGLIATVPAYATDNLLTSLNPVMNPIDITFDSTINSSKNDDHDGKDDHDDHNSVSICDDKDDHGDKDDYSGHGGNGGHDDHDGDDHGSNGGHDGDCPPSNAVPEPATLSLALLGLLPLARRRKN